MTKNSKSVIKSDVERLVRDFREGILNGSTSKGKCFIVSGALEGYMNMMGFDCRLTCGTIIVYTLSEIGEMSNYEHFWIEMSDKTIIDPTADQFKKPDGSDMPDVYIGDRPRWYLCP